MHYGKVDHQIIPFEAFMKNPLEHALENPARSPGWQTGLAIKGKNSSAGSQQADIRIPESPDELR
jgi:hypothetical protein